MRRAVGLTLLLVCVPVTAQRFPAPGELPGKPFSITKTWIVGGNGDWDYLTMDPVAGRLYIAHGPAVQVVDVETGTLAGTITGFRQAHSIALDDAGEFGYVSDGPSGRIRVFDRLSLKLVADIPTGPSPRALALEPQSGLLFAICSGPEGGPPPATGQGRTPATSVTQPAPAGTARRGTAEGIKSTITVIDPLTRSALANLVVAGKLGFAQAAGDGQVYVTVADRNEIMRIDASAMGALLRGTQGPSDSSPVSGQPIHTKQPLLVDWSDHPHPPASTESHIRFLPLGPECRDPRGLAVDGHHLRLFTACDNMKMVVTSADTGAQVASLPIGPGVDAVGYDPDRGLIFTANGGGDGSITIIRQDVTDTYSVIQNLPTRQQTRTLAIDPSSGNVYLVTALQGAVLGQPPLNGIGTFTMKAVNSSFQVLVIAN